MILATTDAAIDGVHFRLSTTTPELIGQRVLAVNLSDIASMGGEPRWALLTLSLPPALAVSIVERLADGIAIAADRYNLVVVGGNLARSPDRLIVDLTLLGEADPTEVLYRHGAHPGDRIMVTGTLGDSAAGFALLEAKLSTASDDADYLIGRHRLPTPRIEVGRAIASTRMVTAAIDLSDGLADAVRQMAAAAGERSRPPQPRQPGRSNRRRWLGPALASAPAPRRGVRARPARLGAPRRRGLRAAFDRSAGVPANINRRVTESGRSADGHWRNRSG